MAEQPETEPMPRWTMSERDLPQDTSPACYCVTPHDGGETFKVTIKDRKRQVVDAMIQKELFCASTVRIGDAVFRLKEDSNLCSKTERLSSGRQYYTLLGTVEYLGPVSAGVDQ
ncbi:hypothetical protein [uncultured Litoreibacter sp.]|uniref:hypothetical protein n=1 Tax=uncultured Litoreibacter sp. TaxID=1392394 RepID=UPI0026390CB1|nr:hypothetical protein [uncultured Litoreibacter sp.]